MAVPYLHRVVCVQSLVGCSSDVFSCPLFKGPPPKYSRLIPKLHIRNESFNVMASEKELRFYDEICWKIFKIKTKLNIVDVKTMSIASTIKGLGAYIN